MEQLDTLTKHLISNGDVSVVRSQTIYEYAWAEGIRPLREDVLKPERMLKRQRIQRKKNVAYWGSLKEDTENCHLRI